MTSAALLELIANAARAGQRCPARNDWAMRRLIKEGWVETRVYAQNWRVVKIVRGEFAGLETLRSPHASTEPWVIVTASGTTRRAGTARPRQPKSPQGPQGAPEVEVSRGRREPSKPRLLSSNELSKFLELDQ